MKQSTVRWLQENKHKAVTWNLFNSIGFSKGISILGFSKMRIPDVMRKRVNSSIIMRGIHSPTGVNDKYQTSKSCQQNPIKSRLTSHIVLSVITIHGNIFGLKWSKCDRCHQIPLICCFEGAKFTTKCEAWILVGLKITKILTNDKNVKCFVLYENNVGMKFNHHFSCTLVSSFLSGWVFAHYLV